MSDQAPAQPTAQPQPPEAMQIAVHAQYLRDFSFESPNAPQIFSQLQTQPALNIGVNIQTRPAGDKMFEVMLMLKLEAKIGDKTAFIAELAYGGLFGLPAWSEEMTKAFLFVEAPRILFPFARNILADAVRDGGFPQILLQPIDFAALYQQQAQQMAAAPQGTA